MRENNRNTIEIEKMLPQFTTMNVIDGQAGIVNYSSLIFYSLTIDNILNIIVLFIVLLILAGITISAITSDNGIIQNAISAKERAEMANEREIVEQATVQAMGKNKRGNIVRNELQEELDKITGEGKTTVTADTEEQGYFVKFVDSGRIYKVSIDGEVTYLGIEDELITQAEIVANPESNTTSALVQQVDLTVKTPIEIEGAEYSLVYAWNQDKENAPEDTKFLEATLIGNGRIRTTTVFSSDTVGGDYYLWVRVVVGEIEREVCFGPYTIRDHTTLIATSSETESTAGFLGNTEIERRLIESINIETSLSGYSINDENTWDVSQSQNGMYLAWYEDSDNDGYYEVTIAGDGGVVANSNSRYLFGNIGYDVKDQEVTITGLENLETGLVTDMHAMFRACKVQQLNLNTFDTSKVTSLEYMFYNCTNLETLDLNNFDTSNVTTLFGTFQGCTNLKTLEVSNWNTSKVVGMGEQGGYWAYGGTFQGCSSLTELDLSGWNTSNVKGMGNMFRGCSTLTELNVSNFNTENAISMYGMFWGCNKLQKLNVSNFDTSNVTTSLGYMFSGCSNLTELDVSNFDTSHVTNMAYMFNSCNSLTKLNVNNFNTNNVTNMQNMFSGCSSLKELNVSNFNTSHVTNMAYMFGTCRNLRSLNVNSFDTSHVTDMRFMFNNCSSLTTLDVSNFNTDKVTNMWHLFWECSSLETLNISNFNIQNVTDWTNMFLNVPTTIQITTNQNTKDWILDKFPNYTNIVVVE